LFEQGHRVDAGGGEGQQNFHPGRWSSPAWRAWAAQVAADPQRPNIIFILSDDVGMSEIGCYAGNTHKTPNIDALAMGGTQFEYGYAMASWSTNSIT
jgi:arylsulfatase A-like enzyme